MRFRKKELEPRAKISDSTRYKLIDLVCHQGKPVSEAAILLGLKYPSAKTIVRLYKKENRIHKKPARSYAES